MIIYDLLQDRRDYPLYYKALIIVMKIFLLLLRKQFYYYKCHVAISGLAVNAANLPDIRHSLQKEI